MRAFPTVGLVSCRKTHEPAHKADYERAQKEKDYFFDIDAFEILENAVKVVDSEISRIREKLDREAREQNDSAEVVKTQRVGELDEKIQKLVEEIEALGNQGKIEESMKLTKSLEELRSRRDELNSQSDMKLAGPGSNAARLRVCDECGAQLNIMDHESRIADHYNGKMHLGMVECRERHRAMLETMEARRRMRREMGGDERSSNRDEKRRSPRRDRDRDRERDSGSSRRRSRSRERDRGSREERRSHRDRDRGDSRRDRDRDRRH